MTEETNPDIIISIVSVFFQGYDAHENINVIEINKAVKHLCLSQGWDFIDHGNIAFRHFDKDGMHLTS